MLDYPQKHDIGQRNKPVGPGLIFAYRLGISPRAVAARLALVALHLCTSVSDHDTGPSYRQRLGGFPGLRIVCFSGGKRMCSYSLLSSPALTTGRGRPLRALGASRCNRCRVRHVTGMDGECANLSCLDALADMESETWVLYLPPVTDPTRGPRAVLVVKNRADATSVTIDPWAVYMQYMRRSSLFSRGVWKTEACPKFVRVI